MTPPTGDIGSAQQATTTRQSLLIHIVGKMVLSGFVCRDRNASCATTCFFFFNDTATTEIYPLPLHDPLPISRIPAPPVVPSPGLWPPSWRSPGSPPAPPRRAPPARPRRCRPARSTSWTPPRRPARARPPPPEIGRAHV